MKLHDIPVPHQENIDEEFDEWGLEEDEWGLTQEEYSNEKDLKLLIDL